MPAMDGVSNVALCVLPVQSCVFKTSLAKVEMTKQTDTKEKPALKSASYQDVADGNPHSSHPSIHPESQQIKPQH